MKTFLKVWLSIGLIAIVVGIGLVILAFVTEPDWREIETFTYQETYEGIENVAIEVGIGEVKIMEGDSFSIDGKYLPEDSFDCYVSDKTWYIREKYEKEFNLFRGHFSIRRLFLWNEAFAPKITITLPRDFVAEEFSMEIGAGDVEAEKIEAMEGNFSVGVGKLSVEQLIVHEESSFSVGAGKMELMEAVINDASIDGGMGYVSVDGRITGDSYVNTGVGSIRLSLDGNPQDYSYAITAGLGSVTVDRESYSGIVDKEVTNQGAEHFLELECGIGDIDVEFR